MALRQLSVFRGGFDREAATAICVSASSPDQAPNTQFSMLQLLSALIGKSLLARGADGRYAIHELVRQYAGEQLRLAGDAEQTWGRHGDFFLGLVEQAEPHLKGADEAIWFERLLVEHDNLRAALDHALAGGAVELAARICVVLRWLWYMRGYIAEGRQWIERTSSGSRRKPAAATAAGQAAPGRWRAGRRAGRLREGGGALRRSDRALPRDRRHQGRPGHHQQPGHAGLGARRLRPGAGLLRGEPAPLAAARAYLRHRQQPERAWHHRPGAGRRAAGARALRGSAGDRRTSFSTTC